METDKTVTGETAHLVSMANDIAVNLSFHEDADERIADHINRYWTPRMRGLLLDYAAGGAQDLSELILPVLKKLRK